jgi:Zn-dependent membrane protease YugP
MEYVGRFQELLHKLLTYDIPEHYWVVGGLVFLLVATFLSEWLTAGAINLIIMLFRLGEKRGPVGRDLAKRMLRAAGETRVRVGETAMDTGFRLTFGDIDYRPKKGSLELTGDKASGASIASAGLVTLEVGRALQYRRGFPLVYVQRTVSPFVNIAGYAWILPTVAAGVLPSFDVGVFGPRVASAIPWVVWVLYTITAILLGTIGFYLLLKIPIDLDAARRGVSAMKSARVFTFGEALMIRIFLGIILSLTAVATFIVALNFLKGTVRSVGK